MTDRNLVKNWVVCQVCHQEIKALGLAGEGRTFFDYTALHIGATSTGDLVIWCKKHDEPVAIIPNDQLPAYFKENVCGIHEEKGN